MGKGRYLGGSDGVYVLDMKIGTEILFDDARYCGIGGVLVDLAGGAVVLVWAAWGWTWGERILFDMFDVFEQWCKSQLSVLLDSRAEGSHGEEDMRAQFGGVSIDDGRSFGKWCSRSFYK